MILASVIAIKRWQFFYMAKYRTNLGMSDRINGLCSTANDVSEIVDFFHGTVITSFKAAIASPMKL